MPERLSARLSGAIGIGKGSILKGERSSVAD